MIAYTAEDWIKAAQFDGATYWREADGEDYAVTVPAGCPVRTYGLRGAANGSISVDGAGDGSALRDGPGDGSADQTPALARKLKKQNQ